MSDDSLVRGKAASGFPWGLLGDCAWPDARTV